MTGALPVSKGATIRLFMGEVVDFLKKKKKKKKKNTIEFRPREKIIILRHGQLCCSHCIVRRE